ncbi:MAG TPA: protease complex subunit PrcB family protein [Gammaproteobacteria bacterium]|nr:protease complex subunit PrcB family protein [Gammaproteobacteria bacterium]
MFRQVLMVAAAGMAACLVTACAAGAGGGPEVPFETVFAGRHSGVYNRYFTVIRDGETFAEVWQRARARQYPTPAPPDIDFSRYQVIAVFLGEKRTGGYDISIAGLMRSWKGITATVRVRQPGAGCNTTQSLTQPFEIIKMPVTGSPIHFVVQRVAESCD